MTIKHAHVTRLNFLLAVGALVAISETAHADTITISGTACQASLGRQVLDIDRTGGTVANTNTLAQRSVTCPIPFSPLIASPNPTLFVDGVNGPGATISCTVTMMRPDGTTFPQQDFSESNPASATANRPWRHSVTFAIGPGASASAYAFMDCILPAANDRGPRAVIVGVTSLQ